MFDMESWKKWYWCLISNMLPDTEDEGWNVNDCLSEVNRELSGFMDGLLGGE